MYTTIIINPDDLLDFAVFIISLGVLGYITRKLYQSKQYWFGKTTLLLIFGSLTLCNLGFVIFLAIATPRNLGDFSEETIGIRTPLKRIYYNRVQMHRLSFDFYLEEIYEIPEDVALQLQSPPTTFWDYPQINQPNYTVLNWQRGPLREDDEVYIYLPDPSTINEDDSYFWQELSKVGQALQEGRGYYSYVFNDSNTQARVILILLPNERLLIRIINVI